MGVRGLTQYINDRSKQYFEPFQLHDSYLIIDGNSVACCIYKDYAQCNCIFGGDYDVFSQSISKFFDELLRCNITPLVIFDGATEKKKLKTVILRRKYSLRNAASLVPQSRSEKKLFPILFGYVFMDVMRQKGIKCVATLFEADNTIAALAMALDCPVLSSDSDFYIFGSSYIPFDTLMPGIVKLDNNAGHAKRCHMYKFERLLRNFKEQDLLLAPLFAMLLGNDYVNPSIFNKFFAHLKLKGNKHYNERQHRIEAVLTWLRSCTLDYALTSILNRIPKYRHKQIIDIIEMAINSYITLPTQMLELFNIPKEHYEKNAKRLPRNFKYERDINKSMSMDVDECSDVDKSDTCEEDNDSDHNYNKADHVTQTLMSTLPHWFIQEYIKAEIPRYLMDVIVNKLYVCYIQMEDFNRPSTVLTCEGILETIFGLLISPKERKSCCIRYLTRERDTQLIYHEIKFKNNNIIHRLPSLHDLRTTLLSARKQILHNTLKVNENFLNDIPCNWQLYIAALNFWIKQQNDVSACICHIYALLFCMLYGIVDKKIGYYRTMKSFKKKYMHIVANVNTKANGKVENVTNITITEACERIEKDDCLLAALFFIPNFNKNEKIFANRTKFRAPIVHFFSEFQSCLMFAMDLNILLGHPYDHPIVGNMFNGTLLYNLAVNFKHRKNLDTYITVVLQRSPSLLQLFNALLLKVKGCIHSGNSMSE